MGKFISYYQKELLTKKLVLLVMYVFLLINLFPILWMVFCSIKNNADILSGNVGFSRARTDIYSFYKEPESIAIFSIDGSVTRIDKSTGKTLNNLTIKGLDVNYTADDQFFYMTNSNKGLYKVDKKSLKILEKARIPVRGVDANKFGKTSIVNDENNVYFALELKGVRNVYVYDKDKLDRVNTIQLNLPETAFIRSLKLSEGFLYIGTNDSMLKYDISNNEITNSVYLGKNYYPSGVQKIIYLQGDKLILLAQNNLLFMNMATNELTKKRDYGLTRFEDAFIDGKYLYIANARGLTVVDLNQDEVITLYSTLIKELKDGINVDHDSPYAGGELSSIMKMGNTFYLGSTYGRISMMTDGELIPFGDTQLPLGYRLVKWSNYVDLWVNIDFKLYLKNSTIISGFTMVFAMILATLTSYALIRYKFPGNKNIGIAILSTQMIPGIMYLIPLFMMFKLVTDVTGIPVKGTYAGLIFIYTAFFVPFSVWILRSFFASIPVELEEAASIDGCTPFQVFYKIVLPLAVPGIIATGIYIFLMAWDELMFAWVLTSSDTLTIPIGIRLFVGNFQNRYDLMLAAATVATLPVLLLFFVLQKHIVNGLTAGAVKG